MSFAVFAIYIDLVTNTIYKTIQILEKNGTKGKKVDSIINTMIENKQFVLTVNYKKDPFGVPIANTTISATKEYAPNLKRNGGFFYDTYVDGGRNFAASHLRYWDEANHFTKESADSYEKGYKYFYGISNTDKMLIHDSARPNFVIKNLDEIIKNTR